MEGILGWDTTVNGNLAEQLIEPSLLGAYEGAAVTVLGKGVNIPAGAADAWGSGAESAFPDGSTLLTAADCGTIKKFLRHQGWWRRGLSLEPAPLFPAGRRLRAHRFLQARTEQLPARRRDRFPLLEGRPAPILKFPWKFSPDLG